ncbi:MAG TPA: methylamine dehydrogenase light chain [Candidatus Binataceae bacterium]|nr:methylamine dehydrogenase light chain [Candidatus Binataceae bacterium]
MDNLVERMTRAVAQRSSRRSFIARVGKLLVGAAFIPLLPIDRVVNSAAAAEKTPKGINDDTSCDYWKYCAVDGYLCSCCGGTSHDCPPGATPSPTSWVGTCTHPTDSKQYIVSYRDCCGQSACGRCLCGRTEGEMPLYRTQLDSDLIWCFGSPTMMYHCSTAEIVGAK